MKLRNVMISTAAAMIMLAGCDTGDGSIGNAPAKGNVNGLVVVPAIGENNATTAQCGSLPIPGGYLPLADANVTYVDENGSTVLSQATDSCGRFYGNMETAGLKTVTIAKAGYHTMLSDISFFDNGGIGWGIVSTADSNNSFAVRVNTEGASMTYRPKNGTFKYSVIDTKSGRAVLGIPQTQVELYKNQDEANITQYLFNNLNADLVLTLDASGSMESEWTDSNGSAIGTGFDLVYHASKSFIDNLSGNAQLGINVFHHENTFIDRKFIDGLQLDGTFNYAVDGFERNKKNSKFVIDIYHPHSHVYEENSTLIPEFPYTTTQTYPWENGLTAYRDAAFDSVKELAPRASEQKIVVLMTDGGDNSSSKTIEEVINEALAQEVTFYTISMGSFTDSDLAALARATGGVYIKADGTDIGQKFSDVLSEIQYFYEVGTLIEENTTAFYRVDVKLDGETVSGKIDFNSTVPPTPQPPVDETEGARLYTKCKTCHGIYGEQTKYDKIEMAAINTLDASTLKSALDAYKAGTLDQYGYGKLMQVQLETYSDEQIVILSEYIPTLKVPDTNDTNGSVPNP